MSQKELEQITKQIKEVKKMKSGVHVFKEGEIGDCVYVLQTGQVRLFKPKGKGYFEVGVVKPGEIFGDGALWEDSVKHNVSAEALTDIEYMEVEISVLKNYFAQQPAFVRALFSGMNLHIKKYLVKIKDLESANLSFGDDEYVFMKDHEVAKLLTTYFFVAHSFGQWDENKTSIKFNKKLLKVYGTDVYGISEAKFETLVPILKTFQLLLVEPTGDGQTFCKITSVELFRSLLSFYQAERFVANEKKLKIPPKTFIFLEDIFKKAEGLPKGTVKLTKDETFYLISIKDILANYEFRNMDIGLEELDEAKRQGFVRDTFSDADGEQILEFQWDKLRKFLPIMRFQQSIKKLNESKSRAN
jgi:CRP/FNR family cyclic AMP-dependent transcriptional regulator